MLAKSYLEFIVAPLVGHLHKKSADKFGEMLGLGCLLLTVVFDGARGLG